jgi:hypothetical protein
MTSPYYGRPGGGGAMGYALWRMGLQDVEGNPYRDTEGNVTNAGGSVGYTPPPEGVTLADLQTSEEAAREKAKRDSFAFSGLLGALSGVRPDIAAESTVPSALAVGNPTPGTEPDLETRRRMLMMLFGDQARGMY